MVGGIWSVQADMSVLQPPLLQKMAALHCTTDLKTAQSTVDALFHSSAQGYAWPDEWLGETSASPALHAGTLDILLYTLKSTAERFPSLREDIERVALQWNYCDVVEDAQFFDLSQQSKQLHKQLAATDVPLQWQGFKQWGFLTPDPTTRFVPRLLDEIRLSPLGYQYFLHRVYRKQCFPHPETGLLATEAEAAPLVLFSRVPTLPVEYPQNPVAYPYTWNPVCTVAANEPPPPAPSAQLVTPDKTTNKSTNTPPQAQHEQPPAPPNKTETKTAAIPTPPLILPPANPVNPPAVAPRVVIIMDDIPPHQAVPPVRTARALTPVTRSPLPQRKGPSMNPANGYAILPTIVSNAPANDIPIFFDDDELDTDAQNAKDKTARHSKHGGKNGKQGKHGKKKKLRLAGNIADTYSLKDGSNTLSASATWSPKENWFVNGNVSMKDGKLGYSWGAGYADWRPGTWSAQVNNYGPITPGKGLDLGNASASVGYKVKSATLDKYKLNASAGANLNGKGKGSVNATLQWNPKPKWYARTTASMPLSGGTPTWSYGVGYSDPRPGKWRVEYSNYGNNKFPGDNLKDGSITINRGWQF